VTEVGAPSGPATATPVARRSICDNRNITYGADGKPNLSYAELIRRAIDAAPDKRMTLNEIYQWIVDNFDFYRRQEQNNRLASWKNSIRHNLSLNKTFVREQRGRTEPGKGSYWRIDEEYRQLRVQQQMRNGPTSAVDCGDRTDMIVEEMASSGALNDRDDDEVRQPKSIRQTGKERQASSKQRPPNGGNERKGNRSP
jgi:hypothetical protein